MALFQSRDVVRRSGASMSEHVEGPESSVFQFFD